MSFLCALPGYAVGIIIGVTVLQYAFALFCLMKLAYIDISKREYVLWNVFILLVFFIGGIVFLVYYNKVKDEKKIKPIEQSRQEPVLAESESVSEENKDGEAAGDVVDDKDPIAEEQQKL